ncbi:type VII secretion system-associated protein [Streptomyces sp. NPDC001744]|uniref:type VII secretion system-associated protein n=1 Tax=Streptomyces sp. NPDC001744 TaxID=3364606 RepID=UPI003687C73C
MAENKPPTQLNKEWIKKFKDEQIGGFRKALKAIAEDGGDPVVPAMKTLMGKDKNVPGLPPGTPLPLAIGNLAEDDRYTHGKTVNAEVVKMVSTLEAILTSHAELFKDIDAALEETIDSLFTTQGVSLDAIDGQKLYDIFEDEDVEDDLTDPPGEGDDGGGDDKD